MPSGTRTVSSTPDRLFHTQRGSGKPPLLAHGLMVTGEKDGGRARSAGADGPHAGRGVTVVLVDSNVLIDVTTDDPTWGEWSSRSLMQAADEAVLVIDALIYTEGSIGFDSIELLEEALPHDP
jgi:hypothetical protein